MRTLLLILGLVALAFGLLWIGQGTGMINWPASSFMIRQIQWAGYGAALAGHTVGECTCSGRTPSPTKRAVTPCNQGIALMMRANIGA
jgi:hypothetical protein